MAFETAPEEQFGPYLVYERLGVGGMATVHRALEHGAEGFERTVALKRLLPHLAEDASFIKSFVREAKLAALLNHVNIVQIYELGRVGKQYFISMEYIDGRDLRQLLRHARKVTGPPPVHVTVGLLIQLCDALDYAHAKVDDEGHPMQLVHRDISPSNLLVTSAGHLKVIDFGIAKAQSTQLRTQTGRVKGKLAYMSPEAISGAMDLDARSDIWAVGVVLYEMLTARPLFASKNEYETMVKVQRGDILPPSTYNQACPPELDAIVLKALARRADDRFADAAEMRDVLHAVKRQYQLATGYRDMAMWLEWAFGQGDVASGGDAAVTTGVSVVDPVSKQMRAKTPLPAPNREEDEAVEMVWGAGEGSSVGPVLLDDVPDVSVKNPAARADTVLESFKDDIPEAKPSHGPRSTGSFAATDAATFAEPRGQAQPPHQQRTRIEDAAALARGTDVPVARGSAQVATQRARTTGQSQNARPDRTSNRISSVAAVPEAEPPEDEVTPPPGKRRRRAPSELNTTTEGKALPVFDQDLDTGRASRLRPSDLFEAVDEPLASARSTPLRAETLGVETTTSPEAKPMTNMPSVPVVRFTRSIPPINKPTSTSAVLPVSKPQLTPGVGLALPLAAPPSTKPGHAPAPAVKPRSGQRSAQYALPLGHASGPVATPKPTKLWVFIVVGLVLAAATAGLIVVIAGQRTKAAATARREVPVEAAAGFVRFIAEPADTQITIDGADVHTGTPWSDELVVGAHQIELHHAGYKPWLTTIDLVAKETQTLHVVLGALDPATSGDATLAIETNPPGAEVVLDGQALAQHTPVKTTVAAGPHVVAVKQNGAEVWRHSFSAQGASDYAFSPTLSPAHPAPQHHETAPSPAMTIEAAPDAAAPPPAAAADGSAGGSAGGAGAEAAGSAAGSAAQPAPAGSAAPARSAAPAAAMPDAAAAAPARAPASAAAPPTSPPVVPPKAVTKQFGDPPDLGAIAARLPAVVAAKLCIDATGAVTSAEVVNKLDPLVAEQISTVLRTWHYVPYAPSGTATPACFAITFKPS